MDHGNSSEPGQQVDAETRRARTLVVRWWGDPGDNRDDAVRGTLRDIGGAPLGAFEDFDALVALLRRQARSERAAH